MRKWRIYTAVFLASLFLALSFGAEFAHNHLGTQTPLAFHADGCEYVNENTTVGKRSLICIACIQLNTPIAVDHQSCLIRIDTDRQPYFVVADIVAHLDSHRSRHSRAPPYKFS